MPRPPRIDVADIVCHVINRANNRATIFKKPKDYTLFETLLRLQHKDRWLADTIVPLPTDYLRWVNESEDNQDTLRKSVNKGTPFGSDAWVMDTVETYGLNATVTEQGRPRKC